MVFCRITKATLVHHLKPKKHPLLHWIFPKIHIVDLLMQRSLGHAWLNSTKITLLSCSYHKCLTTCKKWPSQLYGTSFKTNKKQRAKVMMGQSFFEIHFVDLLFQSTWGILDWTQQKLHDQIVASMNV